MGTEASTTDMQISPMNKAGRCLVPFIRPTAMERQRGRIMRAPDHDAGTGGGGAAGGDEGAAASGAGAGAGDAGASAAAAGEGETSLLGGGAVGSDDNSQAGASQDGQGDEGEGQGGEGEGGASEQAPEHVVPEAYELSLEGAELDAAAIEEATPFFKEAGLSNDQANKIMPAAAKFRESVAGQTLQQIVDAGAKQKADWAEAARNDPDIGGAKLEETLHLSGKALDALGYPEGSDFRKVLTETGFGNHPEMVRMMRKVGEMVSEDGFPRAGAAPASQISPEKRLYPND